MSSSKHQRQSKPDEISLASAGAVSRAVASTALLSMAMYNVWSKQQQTKPQTSAIGRNHDLSCFGTNLTGDIVDRWYEFLRGKDDLLVDLIKAQKMWSEAGDQPSASCEEIAYLGAFAAATRFALNEPDQPDQADRELYRALTEMPPGVRNTQGEESRISADETPLARLKAEIENFGTKVEAACQEWDRTALASATPSQPSQPNSMTVPSGVQTERDTDFGRRCDAVGSIFCGSTPRYRVLQLESDVNAIFHPKHGELGQEVNNLSISTAMADDRTKMPQVLATQWELRGTLAKQRKDYLLSRDRIKKRPGYPKSISISKDSIRTALLSAWGGAGEECNADKDGSRETTLHEI